MSARTSAESSEWLVLGVIFFLNIYYWLVVIPKEDRAFYPSSFARWFGWFGLIVFTAMSALLIFARVFNIPLFGA